MFNVASATTQALVNYSAFSLPFVILQILFGLCVLPFVYCLSFIFASPLVGYALTVFVLSILSLVSELNPQPTSLIKQTLLQNIMFIKKTPPCLHLRSQTLIYYVKTVCEITVYTL